MPGPRKLLRLAAVLVAAAAALALAAIPAHGQAGGRAVEIELSGTIDPATADWIDSALADARRSGAELVVIRLDTPGGLDSSMREIVRDILSFGEPVVVHVAPSGARAASAGLFIAQAADVAVMAAGTNIGAATPVSLGGGETSEVLGRKIRNDAAAYVRALAQVHGRDPELAEEMVRDAVSVTADRAAQAGLIDFVAPQGELLERLDGFRVQGPRAQKLDTAGLSLETREMPWHVEVRQALVNPNLSYLLLLGGALLVVFEVVSPGLVGPGLFGAVMLVLGLYGTAQLPVTIGGIVLLLIGLGFLIAETQVASGLLGIAGVVAVIAGGLLLYDTDSEVLAVSVPAAIAAGVVVGGLVVFAASKSMSLRRRPAHGDPAADLVGRTAQVRQALDPLGQVYVQGSLWRARTAGGDTIPAGTRTVVDAVEGLTLLVHPVPDSVTEENP